MPLNIVFMGTPEFAATCLKGILNKGYTFCGVFSQPDRPKGRGQKVTPTPVKELAEQCSIPVFQPDSLRDGKALEALTIMKPDLIVVVAYGRLLPKEILELPPLGCINLHASLLPKLRGAAPIQWSVMNGDTVTGVTSMYMAEGMDTGDMILSRATPIAPAETAGELSQRLALLGGELLAETIPLIIGGKAPRIPQDEHSVTFAPRILKEDAAVDFRKAPKDVVNQIRGMNPSPLAYAQLNGERVLLHAAQVADVMGFPPPPGVIGDAKRLIVGCGNGAIQLLRVQPQGKKVMDAAAFANGRRLQGGERFDMSE